MNVRVFRNLRCPNPILAPSTLVPGVLAGLRSAFSQRGLFSGPGRAVLRGKVRRFALSMMPPLAERLQSAYGLSGDCNNCGACCQLLIRCPHWDAKDSRCTAYADRPKVCRLFPITPPDLADITSVPGAPACGFRFIRQPARPVLYHIAKSRPAETEAP